MTTWHEEFKAYARAFGKDEVAAILMRHEDKEWLIWPEQLTEGLTFTLTADAILEAVPVEHLAHVAGWVHSHPSGLDPTPSGTDNYQIRELARDLGGNTVDMVIFGGPDYTQVSTTSAMMHNGTIFLTDTKRSTYQMATKWDEAAAAFYKDSYVAPAPVTAGSTYLPTWGDVSEERENTVCMGCYQYKEDIRDNFCGECEWENETHAWNEAHGRTSEIPAPSDYLIG